MRRVLQILLIVLFIASVWLTIAAWWVPLESRQEAAWDAAAGDHYALAEAAGFAEAQWGLPRIAAPLFSALILAALFRTQQLCGFLTAAAAGFRGAIQSDPQHPARWRAKLLGGFVAVWIVLAVWQGGVGVVQRLSDWHAYRLLPGSESLPNISEGNRQVIRYVQSATPENARILVLSDQKLFFLSYYLFPRRLYHPLHPDSEFVIPLAHGERELAAYQFEELTPEYLAEIQPDYILEYFENEAALDPQRLTDDQNWLRFLGSGSSSTHPPRIQVNLRPYQPEEMP